MNIADIESQLRELVDQPFDAGEFPFAFLTIYDAAKATVTKLRQGTANQAKATGDVLLKNKLFFRSAAAGRAAVALDEINADALVERHRPRFLVATDGVEVYARDTKADQTLDAAFAKLNDAFDFFLPLAGIERHEGVAENTADIKATGRLAKLYDAILEANPDWLEVHGTHELNLFMTRMLFCFFAERTGIFPEGLFNSTVLSLTTEDGSNTAPVLTALFTAMNTPSAARNALPDFSRRFPYVNGGLFRENAEIPAFSRRARRLFKDCGDLNWRDINPDIFGSMIQAVVEPGLRSDMGMHYTSVPNIMKVLRPLFLLSLEDDLAAAWDSPPKLKRLLQRIYNIRVFDPACGSGNFLIIAYRELRKLETKVFLRQKDLVKQMVLPMSGVHLSQFSGIELTDFAAETAKLSLWISEYQLNEQFKIIFGSAPPALPLRDSGNIKQGNATQIDWTSVCPAKEGSETYVVGNPPYLGGKKLSPSQASDMDAAGLGDRKQLDYIGCWYFKAADYARAHGTQFAFVATSSVCQGEQVHLLWSYIFGAGLELSFAYEPFEWSNNAQKNATVSCTVTGIARVGARPEKWLFSASHGRKVKNISPYLIEGDNTLVTPAGTALNGLPAMCMGSNPVDGKHLILSKEEHDALVGTAPTAAAFVRRYMGGEDFLHSVERYCLWIADADVKEARRIPFIRERLDACQEYRSGAGRDAQKTADVPHRFCYRTHRDTSALIYPNTSAASRLYVPAGFTDGGTVINKDAFAIYDPNPFVFGILSSTLHRVWLAAAGGRLGMGYRYSVKLVYNTFPIPDFSAEQKNALEPHVLEIIDAREAIPGATPAWLYDPETMPERLRDAHNDLDRTLENFFIGRDFKSDTERLEHLFKLYRNRQKKLAKLGSERAGTRREAA